MQLEHVPYNNFDDYSPQFKAIYSERDNIKTAAEFEQIKDTECSNCVPDQANMPHSHGHCPTAHISGAGGEVKFSPARVARVRQRVSDNFDRLRSGKPATYVALVATALGLDERFGGHEHTESCIYLAETSPIDVQPDTSPDDIFSAHDDCLAAIVRRAD